MIHASTADLLTRLNRAPGWFRAERYHYDERGTVIEDIGLSFIDSR